MTPAEALMSEYEYVDVHDSIGRIMARPVLSCPPCVPLYIYGEVIGEDILQYHTGKIAVIKP
jgi:arginine/lysine/ornithine decarboxylase